MLLNSESAPTELHHGAWTSRNDHKQEFGRAAVRFTSPAQGPSPVLLQLLRSNASPRRDVYQFGVYTGIGLAKIAEYLEPSSRAPSKWRGMRLRQSVGIGHLWGFDSFQGIPEEAAEEQNAWSGTTAHFQRGGYSAADALRTHDTRSLVEKVARLVSSRSGRPIASTTFVQGFFNESLTPGLLESARRAGHPFQPALFVDMDVDIYTSTVQAMDWMLANRLIVAGSIVRYDDWPTRNATTGRAAGTSDYGQARAHREVTERHRIVWRRMAGLGRGSQFVFMRVE